MDKKSYQPMTIGHVASERQKRNEIKRKRALFSNGCWNVQLGGGGGGGRGGEGESNSKEVGASL